MKDCIAVAAFVAATLSSGVVAQTFPAKPVRVVNPFAPGGNTDIVTRAITERLVPVLKQQVIIEHRPGAMTNIASEYVAKAPPDGYTLLMGGASNAINMSFLAKVPYDTMRDLEPVILCLKGANVLAVHPSLPVRNLKELIALARSQPGKLNYASSGLGSSNHMAGELLKLMTKIDIQHIPYKGNNPALTDTMGGHVHMLFAGVPSLLPPVQSGRLRAIAISSLKRAPAMAQVPTFDESGVKGYEATNWFGLFAPAKTPREIVAKLNAEIDKVIHQPELVQRFGNDSLEVIGGPPESFRSFVAAEIEKYARVIKAAGIPKQ
ncbi:MAG TPA: tripartite tricarboxylate transporter substrate binding protein [Burkholderiales bacterium]|nr:tripartite tricarboxylate transporter substrate binding protein [Burkholderiales bacterium]